MPVVIRIVMAAAWCLLATVAAAAEASSATGAAESDADALAARIAGLDDYAATFQQAIADTRGRILEESTGYMLLKRPNFKWVVDDPYPQVIVIEDETLKVYDPDLEQLTLKPLDEALTDTPISLLMREDVALGDDFDIVRVADLPPPERDPEAAAPSTETFLVTPRAEDSLFAEIRIAFSAQGLSALGILDHLGQYTEIRFQADPDRVIQSADFELEVPPGTDVIGG